MNRKPHLVLFFFLPHANLQLYSCEVIEIDENSVDGNLFRNSSAEKEYRGKDLAISRRIIDRGIILLAIGIFRKRKRAKK